MEKEFLQTAEQAARRAGEVLRDWAGKFSVREKSRANLVTEADHEAQRAIFDVIHGRYPEHSYLGEEGLNQQGSNSDYRWVIDPLDGTSNYVHGFPFYAVSIALECKDALLVGVIYDPNSDELFQAARGKGATLNGVQIATSTAESLCEALVVASLPIAAGRDHPAVERFLKVLPVAQHLQRTGSAAMNLAYVACGRIDAFWSESLKPWDVAAGALIVEEAGGRIGKMNGDRLEIEVPDMLAAGRAALYRELQALLA